MPRTALVRAREWIVGALPSGRPLDSALWESRHALVERVLVIHIPALLAFGLLTHHSFVHTAGEVTLVAGATAFAWWPGHSRRLRAVVAALALFMCSALLVHLSGGNTEMHFHFFVMVGLISLYQDWVPFLTGLGFVVVHHGLVGYLAPASVYSNPAAQRSPWLWAAIHGAFVLAASGVHILAWRLNEDQTLRDPLTHLGNRTLFLDRLAVALARRERIGNMVVVLYLDLDSFKSVNDTLGHPVGDLMLVEVSQRITATIRSMDTAARMGGDEFAILLDIRGERDAEQVAERVLRNIREPMHIAGHELFANASIGMVFVDDASTLDDVLRNADLAMYIAKAAGRGRVERYEPHMHVRAMEQVQLEADLRFAVQMGAIDVHYQPTVTLDDGRIVGFEALARWNHPVKGPIGPDVFIPIAESTGMIHALGAHVLRTACAQGAEWRREFTELEISVNVSPLQLSDATFADELDSILRTSGLEPSALILELTETVLMQDADETVARLHALKALGVRLAIDDFGTGHSSLSYLRRFPIDVLKIDRSFVESLPGGGAELAHTIVRLGSLLRLDVVAEGVEEETQRLELRTLGCARGQGFLFARAQDAAECDALLRGERSTTQVEVEQWSGR